MPLNISDLRGEKKSERTARQLVLAALALATVLKVAWAFSSAGTCDAQFFFTFAQELHEHSLEYLYRHDPLFNHMPLTGWSMEGIYLLARGNSQFFATIIRL